MESDALSLTVQPMPVSSMPTPKITQAWYPDKVLDVSLLNADVDLTLATWPFIARGQRLWLRFEGTDQDGLAYEWTHPNWQNFPITSDIAQSTKVRLSELQKLKRNSGLRLIAEVSFDGGQTRTPFPVETLTVKTLHPVSGSENWESLTLEALPLDEEVPCSNGSSIRLLAGEAPFVNSGISHPGFGDRTLRLLKNAQFRFFCGGFIGKLSFDLSYIGASTDVNYISFHDAADVEVERENLPLGSYTYTKDLDWPCLYFRIAQMTITTEPLIDNLVWTAWSP